MNKIVPSVTLLNTYAPMTPVPHCETIRAHIASDFFALWENYELETGCETAIPYWAAVWPGAKSLSNYILKNPLLVKGRKVLDFGSGSGVVSIAACKSSAERVVANDIDPIAQHVAGCNFIENSVTVTMTSDNMLECDNDHHYHVILVCDMFYERSTAKPLHEFLRNRISRGSQVIIADGTRPFTPREDLKPLYTEIIEVNNALEGMKERSVTVFQMV